MEYMRGPLDRSLPSALLDTVKSVVVVALPYGERVALLRKGATGPVLGVSTKASASAPMTGKIASYARGEDYHRVLKQKLARLAESIEELVARPVGRRVCVDSAPLLERHFAERAGLGFSAKSTLTIVPGIGSYVLLGELLLDVELEPSRLASGGCGSCTRCLTACPTGAFAGPHVLDARRCISYLTIELKGSVPRELRGLIGSHVFGCDICQDVCPWNGTRHAPPADPELGVRDALRSPDLVELLFLSSSGYKRLVRGTALSRVSRARLARNAAVALGNSKNPMAEAPLARAVTSHSSALVRAHAAWALGELGLPLSVGRDALEDAQAHDIAAEVREEAGLALERLQPDASLEAASGAGEAMV